MTILANPRILVAGGRGFVGRAVCRAAVQAGVDVISLGRRPCRAAAEAGLPPAVHCIQADIFDTTAWAHYLDGCTALVHSIGILVEDPVAGRTYQRLIFESAKAAGDAAVKLGVPRFVFISAESVRPGTPAGYMDNKRRAEVYLSSLNLVLVIARPSLIYGPERPESLENKAMLDRLRESGQRLDDLRPLPVDTVARAVVRAAMDTALRGVLGIDDLERLGTA